jgi:hypothetical protein
VEIVSEGHFHKSMKQLTVMSESLSTVVIKRRSLGNLGGGECLTCAFDPELEQNSLEEMPNFQRPQINPRAFFKLPQ